MKLSKTNSIKYIIINCQKRFLFDWAKYVSACNSKFDNTDNLFMLQLATAVIVT